MLKIENIETYGWKPAIRGMRNPMNSWEKSDSDSHLTCEECEHYGKQCHRHILDGGKCFHLGENDLSLMQRLYKGGTEHRKYARMLTITMDVIAPLYWWKEFDTYKVGTVANSCSTMHKIHSKEFTMDDFSYDHLGTSSRIILDVVISALNNARLDYLASKDKSYWWQMIQLLPSSYSQRRTVMMNYENAFAILRQRRNHKLDEWHVFCNALLALPYMREITDESCGA